jgi:hypothetical protein
MSNDSAYINLADGIITAFRGIGRGIGRLINGIVMFLMIIGGCFALSIAYDWWQTDEEATIKRGTEICESHGYVAAKTFVGDGIKVSEEYKSKTPNSIYGQSYVECLETKEGLKVFFEFPTVLNGNNDSKLKSIVNYFKE